MRFLKRSLCAAPLLGAALHPASARADNVVLMAATANVNARPEVRLRWTVTDGWLPKGGFRLYRIEAGKRTLLNPGAPLGVKTAAFNPKALATAATQVALAKHFGKALVRQSTGTVFASLRDQTRALRQKEGPGLSEEAVAQTVAHSPQVSQYRAMVSRPPAQRQSANQVTDEEKVRLTRSRLLVGAMLNAAAAHNLGLAYEDAAVVKGADLQYALRSLDAAGVESAADVATVHIVVGSDPQPKAPDVQEPHEPATFIADLHWEPPTPQEEQSYGLAGYNVTRIDSEHKDGLPRGRVLISYIPTSDGKHVASLTTFRDTKVALGPVTYKITLVDMFGRESPPATVQMTMEDLRTPPPPMAARAQLVLIKQDVTVMWIASSDANAQYRLYRASTDLPGVQPARITPTLVTGTPVDLKSISARTFVNLVPLGPFLIKLNKNPDRGGFDLDKIDAATFLSRLAGSPNPALQAQMHLLTYTDSGVAKDHYYRYFVTSSYPANRRDSAACSTSPIGVPLLTPPTTPSGVAGAFTTVIPARTASDNPGADLGSTAAALAAQRGMKHSRREVDLKRLASTTVRDKKGAAVQLLQIDRYTHAQRPDYGGTVTLTWSPVQNSTVDTVYRVYRADTTGYFQTGGVAATGGAAGGGGAGAAAAAKTRYKTDFTTTAGKGYRYYKTGDTTVLKLAWTLLGQVKEPKYIDAIQRSHAQYFAYRVTAVNRWGAASAPSADYSIRIPATLPPSVPGLLAVEPNEGGQVVITVRPNVADEEVEQYQVYRKALQVTQTVAYVPPATRFAAASGPLSMPPPVQARASVKFGSRSLLSHGAEADRVGNDGAARFGAMRHTSPFSAIGTVTGQKMRAKAVLATIDPAELAMLLDWGGYTQVGVITVQPAAAGAQVTYSDGTAVAGTDYAYRVIAVNHDKVQSASSAILDGTPYKVSADPPTNGSASFDASTSAATITWKAPASGATGYVVKRTIDDGSNNYSYVQLQIIGASNGGAPATQYVDYNTRAHKNYIYTVASIDSSGNISKSPLSVPLKRKP